MPIFNFTCKCGHSQEEILKRDEVPPACEKCGKKTLTKEFPRATSFALKGNGWGADGYADSY